MMKNLLTVESVEETVYGEATRMTHKLKILKHFYEQVLSGQKNFEVRYNDRNYKVGDILHLCPFDPIKSEYLPSIGIKRRVIYVLEGWGVKDGYAVLGLGEI